MKRGFVLGLAFGTLLLYLFTSNDVYALSFEQSMDSYSISAIQNNTKLEDKNISVAGKGYLIDGERAVNNFDYRKQLWKMLPSYRNYYTSVDNNYSLDVYTYHFKDGPALTGSNYDLTFNFAQNYNSAKDSSMAQFENLIVYITSQSGSYVCTGGIVSGVNREYSCVVPVNFDMSTYSITFDFTDISYISEKNIPFGVSYKMKYGATDKEPTLYVPPVVPPDNPNQGVEDAIGNLNGNIMDETPPDLSGLSDSAGWLPAGPLDSILNLPLTMFQNLLNALSNQCTPVVVNLPYVNEPITLPCISVIFSQIEGLSVWWNSIGLLLGGYILLKYLIGLEKWADATLTFRENHWNDWGGV